MEELKLSKYKHYYLTSESVTEGHPDKVCDYISDSILDECLKQDENSRVTVETMISKDKVSISGQITSNAKIDIESIVREKLKEVGYTDKETSMDYRTCSIDINITKQSNDIAMGVYDGGAGDQGIMFGYASYDTEEYMPFAISLAHKLSKRLSEVRKAGIIPYLGPDGKTQVTVEYEGEIPKRIESILISNQHAEDVMLEKVREDIIENVVKVVVPKEYLDKNTKYYINPTGRFVIRWTTWRYRTYAVGK